MSKSGSTRAGPTQWHPPVFNLIVQESMTWQTSLTQHVMIKFNAWQKEHQNLWHLSRPSVSWKNQGSHREKLTRSLDLCSPRENLPYTHNTLKLQSRDSKCLRTEECVDWDLISWGRDWTTITWSCSIDVNENKSSMTRGRQDVSHLTDDPLTLSVTWLITEVLARRKTTPFYPRSKIVLTWA